MEVFFYFFHFLFFWHDATRGTSFSASFAGLATILPHFILGLAYSGWRPCERRCVICVGIDGRSSSSGSHLFYIIYMLFLQSRASTPSHCIDKFRPTCGPLHWRQLHLCKLDWTVINRNWQVAHWVLYTGAKLAHRFHINVDTGCFCAADNNTLEHLFFQCELARILVARVYFRLSHIDPTTGQFTVEEFLFGFSADRQRAIPSIIIFMLLVMKHTIWVARCDFRFRETACRTLMRFEDNCKA